MQSNGSAFCRCSRDVRAGAGEAVTRSESVNAEPLGTISVDEAVIVDITDDRITVVANQQCETPESCATCGGRTQCMQSKKASRLTVRGTETRPLEIGQHVYVEHFSVNEAVAAAALFVLPLLGAFAGYWFWNAVTGAKGETAGAIGAAIVGFTAGFIPGALLEQALVRTMRRPRIVGPVRAFSNGPAAAQDKTKGENDD
ncbi:MAG: hypothetical protein GF418_06640 [Chitinivibrionales bacterium]|nr:hypothetical protein [Chitinivibrionales bacterium]MBD3395288.1 hypothetical protein [Chitinivibrionales bacterium]